MKKRVFVGKNRHFSINSLYFTIVFFFNGLVCFYLQQQKAPITFCFLILVHMWPCPSVTITSVMGRSGRIMNQDTPSRALANQNDARGKLLRDLKKNFSSDRKGEKYSQTLTYQSAFWARNGGNKAGQRTTRDTHKRAGSRWSLFN